MLLREVLRQDRGEAAVDREAIEVDEGDVQLGAQRELEHLLVDEPQLQERVAEAEPGAPVVVDAELELGLADHVGLDEDVAQPVLLVVAPEDGFQIRRRESAPCSTRNWPIGVPSGLSS